MEITTRSLWTAIHGLGFGALYLLACSGAILELFQMTGLSASAAPAPASRRPERFLNWYLIAMTVLAWTAVLTGAYVIYPWYRAVPPPGTADLAMYPQHLLMTSPSTMAFHSIGMEWKEHVAWFAPIAITMVTFVFIRYGRELGAHRQLRRAVLGFAVASFVAAAVAGFFGAMINKNAPVQGGETLRTISGGER